MSNDSVHCQLKSGKLAIAIPSHVQVAFPVPWNFTATITAASVSDATTASAGYIYDLSISSDYITSFKKSGGG